MTPADHLPVAPSLEPVLALEGMAAPGPGKPGRIVAMCALAAGVAVLAALAAVFLGKLIAWISNLAWHGQWSAAPNDPDPAGMGWWTILIPALGGLLVGLMARYGSAAIRGHGIPEAMEQVLQNRSKIPPNMVILKPLSAAIAIGTGGPFGAEGPIIATGGALGSFLGQVLRVTAHERRVLLAAGAAAGMAATFGTPISAVLLVIELLLFEFHARSFIPVAVAAGLATAMRGWLTGAGPAFAIEATATCDATALLGVVLLGLVAGAVGAAATRVVYAIEDGFEKLPIHWMWWPALGGLVVGVTGLFEPRAIGIGYYNMSDLADGRLLGVAALLLLLWKSVAWSIALGSGTSGGTLAPLLTIGGCVGALLAGPLHLPLGVAVLCGMAAVFAGASHAVLASAIFVAEATERPGVAWAALVACAVAWVVATQLVGRSIMVEKIARRGVLVPGHQGEPLQTGDEVVEAAAWGKLGK